MKNLAFLLIFSGSVFAQTNCFTVKSGSYNDPLVWNTNVIPDTLDNISVSAGDTLVLINNRCVNSVTLCTGAVMKIDSSLVLNVYGNWMNSGKLFSDYSTVRFGGSTPQAIAGNSVTTFFNLECDNASGLSVSKDQRIKNLLTVHQGTVNLNSSKFILLSDSSLTASIGPLLNGADILGKISVQRYLSSPVTGWRFLGSSVRTTLNDWKADFLTSGFPGSAYPNYYFCSIYKYNETVHGPSENGYVAPSHASDSLLPGTGYWCWVGPTPDLVDVTGFPKKGDHHFNITMTPNAGKNEDGWNLIANPYPSAIDWDSESWNKTGIHNAIYVWDPETEQYSTYVNGSGINGGSNIIASSQAFWVQANQNNPVLSCTEEVKSNSQISTKRVLSSSSLFLSLKGNGAKDETVVGFRENAYASVEPHEDAIKLFTDNPLIPSLTTITDSTELAINSLPLSFTGNIPLKVKVGASGSYTLSGDGFIFPDNRCAYIEDVITGSAMNIKSEFSYSFFIADTTATPRFVIHISKPVTVASVPPTCSYKTNGKIRLKNSVGAATVSWMDEIGNVLAIHNSLNGKDSLLNLSPGTYSVKINTHLTGCPILLETVKVAGTSAIKVDGSVSNNVCVGENKGEITFNSIAGGTAPYFFKWEDGEEAIDRSNLSSGVYSLIVFDSNNCSDTSHYSVSNVSMLNVGLSVLCDTSNLILFGKVKLRNDSKFFNDFNWEANGQISNETEPEYLLRSVGIHTVVLTVRDSHCVSSTSISLNVSERNVPFSPVSLPHVFSSGEEAVIDFGNAPAHFYKVSVLTSDGKLLYDKEINDPVSLYTLPLGESHGVYLVKCESNGLITTNKIIK